MIITHKNWYATKEYDGFKTFHRILDEFEDKIRKNGCTLTTSANNMAYSITRITDENYLYEYYLGKTFYDKQYGLYSYEDIKGETDLDKVMTALENIMLCLDDYEKFKKELEKNGFEYEEQQKLLILI